MTEFILYFETDLESSIIERVEYFINSQELEITFKSNGSVYRYSNVTKEIINGAMNAPSLGSYLRETVFNHPDKFPFIKNP